VRGGGRWAIAASVGLHRSHSCRAGHLAFDRTAVSSTVVEQTIQGSSCSQYGRRGFTNGADSAPPGERRGRYVLLGEKSALSSLVRHSLVEPITAQLLVDMVEAFQPRAQSNAPELRQDDRPAFPFCVACPRAHFATWLQVGHFEL
jgi:hypothetical protein